MAAGLLATIVVLSFPLAGCGVLGLDGECRGGAEGLRAEHDALLACAGWQDFVYDNIREIEYVQTFDLSLEKETDVTGQAQCRSCRVRVADLVWHSGSSEPRPRNNVELAAILVHEAAHLQDGCMNGEASAERAEAAFLRDLIAKSPGAISPGLACQNP